MGTRGELKHGVAAAIIRKHVRHAWLPSFCPADVFASKRELKHARAEAWSHDRVAAKKKIDESNNRIIAKTANRNILCL